MHAINWGIQVKKGLIDEEKKDISREAKFIQTKKK